MRHDQRIKQRFVDALYDLSETTSLNRITIAMLAEGAGTSRQTFYNHFRDINDLIAYVPISFLNEHDIKLHDSKGLAIAYAQVHEHPAFYCQLPYHSGQNNFRASFEQWVEETYCARYINDSMSPDEQLHRRISISIYACGLTGIFIEWGKEKYSWPIDMLLDAESEFIPSFVREDPL